MSETIIVCAIVGLVLVLVGRSLFRTFTGKNEGCGCGANCPLSGSCLESLDNAIPESDATGNDRSRSVSQEHRGYPDAAKGARVPCREGERFGVILQRTGLHFLEKK